MLRLSVSCVPQIQCTVPNDVMCNEEGGGRGLAKGEGGGGPCKIPIRLGLSQVAGIILKYEQNEYNVWWGVKVKGWRYGDVASRHLGRNLPSK